MNKTPISDRAAFHAQRGMLHTVPIETARQLEAMCEELANQLEHIKYKVGHNETVRIDASLGKWQAMKDGK
jgi:hypothetical protein